MPGILPALLLTTIASLARADDTYAADDAVISRASLAIDTSALREAGAGPAIAHQLRARADAALRRAAVEPRGTLWDPVVAVTIRPQRGRNIGYVATIAIQRATDASPSRELSCDLCTEGELIAQVSAALEALAPALRGPARGRPPA